MEGLRDGLVERADGDQARHCRVASRRFVASAVRGQQLLSPIGDLLAVPGALAQSLHEDLVRGVAPEDREGQTVMAGDRAEGVALCGMREASIHDDRPAGP